jgi:dihydrofolate reductase
MGKIVVAVNVSLDGMFEGPDADISWHRVDDPLHEHFNEVLFPAGALIDGRVTHELMAEFWPTADQEPDAPAPMVAYSRFWRTAPKYVVSRTMDDTGEWNTTVLRTIDPVEVRALADGVDGDVFVGGGQVVAEFRRLGLVDEWRVYTHPVLVGAGRRFLLEGPGDDLELLDTRPFPNGVVLTHYAVVRDVH